MDHSDLLAHFLGFGLLGAVLVALTEKLVPFVPSYVMLLLLGMTAPDAKALMTTVVATAAGSLTGSMIWYCVGRTIGGARVERTVNRFGTYVFLRPKVYRRLADAYRQDHFRVTLIGQTVPVARIYLALPAGVLKLQVAPFITATALGILLWNAPFLILGYLLRGGGGDPVRLGFWISICMIVLELAIVAAVRRFAPRPTSACRQDGVLSKEADACRRSQTLPG